MRALIDRYLPRGAAILSVLVFGGYVLGLVRDRIFARTFGAGAELDAYNAAFVLPELTLGVLVASGLAAPFVPIYLGLSRDDESAAVAFGQTILTGAVLVMGAAALVMFIFAPETASLVAPGLRGSQRDLYVGLFRVMLTTPIIFAASTALGEVLVAERRFAAYGLAPLLYNGGIIVGTVALSGAIGIYGAAIGAVLGALLHLAIRVWGLRSSTFRVRPRLAVRTRAIGEFLRLMAPKMASQPTEQLTFLFFTAVASNLAPGSISALSFARNFQSASVSLIGVSISLAAFPTFATAYAAGDKTGLIRRLATNLATVVVLTSGAAIGLFVLSTFIIEFFLGGGAFDAADVALTASVLSAFALSVPLESLSHLLSRGIYATRHTALQVAASVLGFEITVVATGLLAPEIGVTAIPLGFTIGTGVKVVLLALVLVVRIWRMGPGADAALIAAS